MNREEKAMQSRKNVNNKHYFAKIFFLFFYQQEQKNTNLLKVYDLERYNILTLLI